MTIFRTEHKRNYTVVNNFIVTDKRLSWKAKAIWLYAFSRPDDWEFHLNDLVNQSTDGRDSVKAGLKELEKAGYLCRCQKRKDGAFSNAEWVFYEMPESKLIITKTENPSTGKPLTGNPPLLSTEELPSIEEEQQPVAVFSNRSKEKQQQQLGNPEESKIYPCLREIDEMKLPKRDKIKITERYSEQVAENAVKWAFHPETKIKQSLGQAIWWALDAQPKLPVNKDEQRVINRSYANKFDSMKFFDYQVDTLSKHVEFTNCKHPSARPIVLSFEENNFIDRFDEILRNIQIGKSPHAK